MGTRDNIEQQIKQETEAQLEAMNSGVTKNTKIVCDLHRFYAPSLKLFIKVIDRLLQLVTDIKPELHHNLQLQKKLFGDK
jgi:hypothetical protein